MTVNPLAVEAMDRLAEVKRAYHTGTKINGVEVTYDDMKAAATAVLELRRAAEKRLTGRAKTQINAANIAAMLR